MSTRKSITVHLTPREHDLLQAAARRAGSTPSNLVRSRALLQDREETPMLACLAALIQIHRSLDTSGQLDPDLRAEIVATVRLVAAAARAEAAP